MNLNNCCLLNLTVCIDTWGNIKNTDILKYFKYRKLKYCYIIWDWLWSNRVALSTHVLTSFIFLEKWASEYPLVPFNLYFVRQYLQQYGGRIIVFLYRTPSGTREQIYTLPRKPVKHSLGRTKRLLQSQLFELTSMSPASLLFSWPHLICFFFSFYYIAFIET